MLVGNKVELGYVVSGVIVFGFEHCSPQGKIENNNQTLTEEDSRGFGGIHYSKVENDAILELTRNLQFSLHWMIHHIHIG